MRKVINIHYIIFPISSLALFWAQRGFIYAILLTISSFILPGLAHGVYKGIRARKGIPTENYPSLIILMWLYIFLMFWIVKK